MKLVLNLILVSVLNISEAQEWIEINKTTFRISPSAFSIDTQKNVYIGFSDGTIKKFSAEGELLSAFSLPNQSAITLIEAQNNRKIFIYQMDIQAISILDRFTTISNQYRVSDFDTGFVNMACPAPDGFIWTIENNPQRLKKIDPIRKATIHEVQKNIGDSVSFIKPVQNLIFISGAKGILILDQFGNEFGSYLSEKINYIQFSQNSIIASHDAGFFRLNPATGNTLSEVAFPYGSALGFLDTGQKLAVVKNNSLTFYIID